ncbi:MAG: hypothetical protein ABEJ56_01120 [Candidatus Nanohaloarchaea archaeon]
MALFCVAMISGSVAAPSPRHPLSQVHPTDTDFNMSNYEIFNISQLKLNSGEEPEGMVLNNLSITTEGEAQELYLDYSNDEWDFKNSNINMTGNNITDIDTLKFEEGLTINGSLNFSGGDANLDNGSINDVYSIDGGGDAVQVDDNLDLNENELQNIDGIQDGTGTNTIHLDGSNNVEIPNGNLNLGSNTISNITDGTNDVIRHDGANNVEIPNGDLTVNNKLTVGSTECSSGEFIDGDGDCASATGAVQGDYVNETGDNMTGTLNMSGNPIADVGSGDIDIDPSGSGNINMRSNEIQDADILHSNNIIAGDYSTGTSKVNGNDIYVEDNIEVGGNVVGAGADVAEKIRNESRLEPGTVVEISGNMSVDRTDERHDTEVAGVVSSNPAMVMAKERDGVPVAMTGTARVKVSMENGEISPGDMLTTSSTPGKAMKCEEMDECEGAIIGKAMQPAENPSEIKMLVSMG